MFRFYYHLGDGLTRLGRSQEAYKVYEEAVRLGLFPSVYQRSLHNVDGLTARPWWTLEQMECSRQLRNIERHWTVIRGF
jgi:aspartate beta-hydroxylase